MHDSFTQAPGPTRRFYLSNALIYDPKAGCFNMRAKHAWPLFDAYGIVCLIADMLAEPPSERIPERPCSGFEPKLLVTCTDVVSHVTGDGEGIVIDRWSGRVEHLEICNHGLYEPVALGSFENARDLAQLLESVFA